MAEGYIVRRSLNQFDLFKDKEPLLKHLDIELTERCNNSCIHCNINQPMKHAGVKSQELRTDQWQDVLQQAADLGALSIRFTGGEPLLRDDFNELYLFARKLGMKVVLFTNGRLITPELADLLARIPPLRKIEISVYGMSTESSEIITACQEAYEECRRGIELLREKSVPFLVKSVLLPPNREEIDPFFSWGADITGIPDCSPFTVILDYRARRDNLQKNRLIAKMRNSPKDIVAFHRRGGNRFLQEMACYCEQFSGPKGDLLFSCGAGNGGCVDAYGNYQMCLQLRDPQVVYPLGGGSLLLGLTQAFPSFRTLKAKNPDYLKRCARCFLNGLCNQCPAKAWMEHGSLDTPVEYLCSVAHEIGRYLGLIKPKEQAWTVEDWPERIALLRGRFH